MPRDVDVGVQRRMLDRRAHARLRREGGRPRRPPSSRRGRVTSARVADVALDEAELRELPSSREVAPLDRRVVVPGRGCRDPTTSRPALRRGAPRRAIRETRAAPVTRTRLRASPRSRLTPSFLRGVARVDDQLRDLRRRSRSRSTCGRSTIDDARRALMQRVGERHALRPSARRVRGRGIVGMYGSWYSTFAPRSCEQAHHVDRRATRGRRRCRACRRRRG